MNTHIEKDAQKLFEHLFKKKILLDLHDGAELTWQFVGGIISGGFVNLLTCFLCFYLQSELPHVPLFNISHTYGIFMPSFTLFVAWIAAMVGGAFGKRAYQMKYLDEQTLVAHWIFQNIGYQQSKTSVDVLTEFRRDSEQFVERQTDALVTAVKYNGEYITRRRRWALNSSVCDQ